MTVINMAAGVITNEDVIFSESVEMWGNVVKQQVKNIGTEVFIPNWVKKRRENPNCLSPLYPRSCQNTGDVVQLPYVFAFFAK